MALTEESGGVGMTMPVSPMYGGGNGFGFGGDWAWILLLLILGWGNNGWGNGFGGGYGGGAGFVDTSVQKGFDHAAVMSSLGDITGAITSGFAGVEASANARQIANMQSVFGLQSQFADCCCENRLASCQTQNVIQSEGSATRFADANNTRDIIENCNRNNQAVLDKLCALELSAKDDRINDLERQLTMANLAASQTAQTSRILSDNAAQTVALEQYLNPAPVPAYVVQNPNCCAQNVGCGCGF